MGKQSADQSSAPGRNKPCRPHCIAEQKPAMHPTDVQPKQAQRRVSLEFVDNRKKGNLRNKIPNKGGLFLHPSQKSPRNLRRGEGGSRKFSLAGQNHHLPTEDGS